MERLAVRLTSTIWRTTLALFHPPSRFPVFSVLQNPKFRVLWYVGGLAEVARWMEMLVLSWLVLQATNSPFQLGLVLVFNNAPRPFFSLFAGLIADRFSRHLMLIIGQTVNMAAAAALLTLIVVDLVQPWHVFLIAFIQGMTRSLEDPARRTGILDIVGERRLVNAMSLEVITNTTGKIIGPLIGGILIDTVAFTGAYSLLVAIHLLHWALLILKVRIPNLPRNTQQEPVWKGLGSAVGYALHSPTLISLLYITVVMNAMAFPVRQFIPVIGQDQLHVGATLVGLLVAAEGFGQLAGAGMMALTRNLQYLGRVYFYGSIVVLAMALLFVWSPWYGLAFTLLAIGGIGQAGFSTMQSTITMLSAPQDMRGGMMGLLSTVIGIGTPLGTLEMGALASMSAKWAITGNALVGLLLLAPLVLVSPLISRPIIVPSAVPAGSESTSGDAG